MRSIAVIAHPKPACSDNSVTPAPADDGAFSENPAIGSMLAPTVTNWFNDPESRLKPVGDDDTGDGNVPFELDTSEPDSDQNGNVSA